MIQELESLVRAGQLNQARKILREIKIKKIPRADALAYANLARRLDLPQLSLRILNPIVRPETRRGEPASAAEKIEYAASLRNAGAVTEAIEILGGIDAGKNPQAGFHLALCFFAEWRYRPAIPLLQSYVRSFGTPSYAKCVGKVNLLAALLHDQCLEDAARLITELREETRRSGFSLLYGNTLELAAQYEILRSNWQRAIGYLEEALRLLDRDRASVGALYISKWLAIARSLKAGKVTADLIEVRKRAIELQHWETVRDCALYEAKVSRDREAMARLYYGTPYESYRERIIGSAGFGFPLGESFDWSGDRRASASAGFDLRKATSFDGRARLEAGHALHRFLILVSQDFYRPIPLVSIFSKIFPGEYFNPDSSPNRVHQIIKRFRRWASENSLPIAVEEISGSYRLGVTKSFTVRIPRDPLPLGKKELEWAQLRACLPRPEFSVADAALAIGCSPRSARRLLHWATETGKVGVSGRGPGTRYSVRA